MKPRASAKLLPARAPAKGERLAPMHGPSPRWPLSAALMLGAIACTPACTPKTTRRATTPASERAEMRSSGGAEASASTTAPAGPPPLCDRGKLAPFPRALLATLEADEPMAAETLLLDRLAVAPTDALADVLLDTLRDVAEQERETTTKRLGETPAVALEIGLLPKPRTAPLGTSEQPLGEGRAQAKARSLYPYGFEDIPADEMRRHRALPSHLPPVVERLRQRSFAYPDHDVLGQPAGGTTRIIVASRRGRPRVFSAPFPDIEAARLVGDVLVVALPKAPPAPSPRAAGSNVGSPAPPTDGLFAFDAGSGALLWTAPGVVGAIVAGGVVVTGAPTQLEVREVGSGKIVQTAPLPRKPHALFAFAGQLVAVGSGMEHVFALAKAPPAQAAQLDELPARPPFGDGDLACHVVTAAQAYGARDLARLDEALRALGASSPKTPPKAVVSSLRRMRERLVAWLSPAGPGGRPRADRLDLFATAPTVLPAPPWGRTPPKVPAAPPALSSRLSVRRTAATAFRFWQHPEVERAELGEALALAPAERGKLPPGAREDVPPYLGLASLMQLVPLGQDALLLYGERWLALVRGQRTERLFDLEAYRHPPIEKPKDAFEGSPTAVTAATLHDNVLYLCNGGAYASEARGKMGYVTAIDVRTGALLWQSDPLVCKSELVVWRGFVVTAYGFTSEPDFLYVLDAANGSRVTRSGIENTPGHVRLSGDTVTVFTSEKRITFELREP